MSTKVKNKSQQSKKSSSWDSFKGLEYENWTITYSSKSNRATLNHQEKFILSDINLESIKRFAFQHHDIPMDGWKALGSWKSIKKTD